MPVTQRDVTVYAKRQAAINKSTKKNKLLQDLFKKDLEDGIALPADGPHVIELAPNGGTILSWEDEYMSLYMEPLLKKYGLRAAMAMAEKRMEEIRQAAPAKPEVEVLGVKYVGGFKMQVRANPTYRSQRKVA
jgi:hypothetical protein